MKRDMIRKIADGAGWINSKSIKKEVDCAGVICYKRKLVERE
jgi:hypothetical protein